MSGLIRTMAATLLALTVVGKGLADDGAGVRDVAAALANKVKEVCGGLKPPQTVIRVGHFSPTGDLARMGGGGAGFADELAAALGAFASPNAALEVSGNIVFIHDPLKPDETRIEVKNTRLLNSNGDSEADFKTLYGSIRKASDIARLTGVTVSFKPDTEYAPDLPSNGRKKDILDALPQRPESGGPPQPPKTTAHLDGTLVRARADSPYAVEIRTAPVTDLKAVTALRPESKDGLAFVDVPIGQVYEVRVLNESREEIAVSLSIDGIDQFTFTEDRKSDGRPRYTHWIVDPGTKAIPSEVLILGWHKTASKMRTDSVLSFLVTKYGQGAASKFPQEAQGKIGLITVGISRSFPKGSRSGAETGFGPPREVKQTVVERRIDDPHEFITIRYTR